MNCLACGEDAPDRFLALYPDLRIYRCATCSHVFYQPESAVDLKALYSLEYFKGGEYSDYEIDRPIIQKNFLGRTRDVLRYVPAGRLLEIGSAYGFFLDLIKTRFDVLGFEACEEAAQYARTR